MHCIQVCFGVLRPATEKVFLSFFLLLSGGLSRLQFSWSTVTSVTSATYLKRFPAQAEVAQLVWRRTVDHIILSQRTKFHRRKREHDKIVENNREVRPSGPLCVGTHRFTRATVCVAVCSAVKYWRHKNHAFDERLDEAKMKYESPTSEISVLEVPRRHRL